LISRKSGLIAWWGCEMKSKAKKIITIWFSILIVITLLLPGCMVTDNNEPSPAEEVIFSFPNGAPPLNQEAELLCTAFSKGGLHYLKVWVDLPESLQLVSGALSWEGSISKEEATPTLRAVVKSVKTGRWEIKVHHYIPPEEAPGTVWGPGQTIYLLIDENKAEWGENKPWDAGLPSGSPSNYTPPPISP
jgi:hypothetical protein